MAELRRLESLRWIGKSVDDHWEAMRTAHEAGKKIAWVIGPMPWLTMAMDMPTLMHATYAAWVAGRNMQGVLLNEAAELGFPPESCSYVRIHVADISLVQKGAELKGPILPLPDVLIGGTICPEQRTLTEQIYKMVGCPMVVLDMAPTALPYVTEAEFEERVRYVERQMREEVIPVIEKVAGRPYDYDQLSFIVANLKACAEVRDEILELLETKPAPMTIFDLGVALAPLMHLSYRADAVDFFKSVKAEVEGRVKQGIGALTEEKYRLYWDNYTMWRLLGIMSRILVPLGANILIGRYPLAFVAYPEVMDPEKPLYSLAKVWLLAFKNCLLPEGAKDLISKWVVRYSLDGLLFPNSPACRLMSIGQEDILSEVERRLGVPGVLFDADMVDPEMFSEAQVKTRVQALLEMIDARRRARAA